MTMAWKDLIPWGRNLPALAMSPLLRAKGYAWLARHQQMNQLLDNVTRTFGSGFGFMTHLDRPETRSHFEVSDNDKERE
jgi:hypothetical protein